MSSFGANPACPGCLSVHKATESHPTSQQRPQPPWGRGGGCIGVHLKPGDGRPLGPDYVWRLGMGNEPWRGLKGRPAVRRQSSLEYISPIPLFSPSLSSISRLRDSGSCGRRPTSRYVKDSDNMLRVAFLNIRPKNGLSAFSISSPEHGSNVRLGVLFRNRKKPDSSTRPGLL